MKTCTKCGIKKPLKEFYKNKNYKGDLHSWCKQCYAAYYSKNGERIRENGKSWYWNDPTKVRNNRIKRVYGLSQEEYMELYNAQGGVCAICGAKPNGKMLSVDHDHETNKIRGLLCINCNRILGYAHDSTSVLKSAINYLKGEIHV